LNEEEYAPVIRVEPQISAKKESFGPIWLGRQCRNITSALGTEELCEQIVRLLSSSATNVDSDLLDLLGLESIELVAQVVANREILATTCKGHRFAFPIDAAPLKAQYPGQNATLNTSASKQATKQYRKLQRKGLLPADEEAQLVPSTAVMCEDLRISFRASKSAMDLPNVFLAANRSMAPSVNGKFALPSGTMHNDFADYEEFIIPYVSDAGEFKIQPVVVQELDALLNAGFRGYTTLNRMQSAIFPMAHYSNENILVCAPTGAGKTDVAMLTVLKVVRDHLTGMRGKDFDIVKDNFKIVYIAPMKALAAEITAKFAKRLAPFGLAVREYTGDMQLSRREIQATQMIVTTPEKWDVITRKGQGDVDLVQKVCLLIIDEVHLLQDDRGPVIETLVARTLREVEISQRLVRIVGLSATLPNYVDVASFLRVELSRGLFVFGDTFRPVPLTQQFVGVKGRSVVTVNENMSRVCFEKCRNFVREGHQVMIFVHSRMDTVKTAKEMLRRAADDGLGAIFVADSQAKGYYQAKSQMDKSHNRELQQLFPMGFAFHHAGMLRSDRTLVESLFSAGHVRVLCCTSTLAWGVNLPAHAVIIKGTQVYDQQKGDFVQLGVLDVLQIFGRAGRPQYETHGEGIILTRHENMARYISAVLSQVPIESQFLNHLADNLNAEIALGTVASIDEAVAWLRYSYLYVRMRRNPPAYGIAPKEIIDDPDLYDRLKRICKEAAMKLRTCGMITFDPAEATGTLRIRDVGRVASNYYLTSHTVEIFGERLQPGLNEEDVLALVSSAGEFNNLRVREEELRELDALRDGAPLRIKHDTATAAGKATLLIMAYISKYPLDTFSLISDSNYISQNGGRVLRALFEIVRTQGWLNAALRCLTMCCAFERRVWPLQHPLAQFGKLNLEVLRKLDNKTGTVDRLREMNKKEIEALVGGQGAATLVRTLVKCFPTLEIVASVAPVTGTVLRVDLNITPVYDFDEQYHGTLDVWWVFVENPLVPNYVYCEEFTVNKMQVHVPRQVSFFVPLKDPVPTQFYIKAASNRWLHATMTLPVSLKDLSLPAEVGSKPTDLLPLRPLPISALNDNRLEALYGSQFLFFNAVQTQVFHTLYHGTDNVLVGAPTGSGKTIMAELAMWNALRIKPSMKVVYIAPLKALVKERLQDWSRRLLPLNIKTVELSGDVTPDLQTVNDARIIVTTPEKWDSITRGSKIFATRVSLVIFDEIHLLGGERGHVLEMIVARTQRHSARLIGLSTALATAVDMATWLRIPPRGLFSFRPSVRPVPLEVRIEGFAGRHYCPRMATMNKPAYAAILAHSPEKPVLIFVSSRRQTRLTANALLSYCVNNNTPDRFVLCPNEELQRALDSVQDPSLRHCLSFGIALHHAGLTESDRRISETFFSTGKVQVMIATSTLAWGLNFPAHLVIVKGTEYFDANSHSYVNYPLTDVMQMIGRAGRPQFDTSAKAVLLVQDSKKDFYKKFLYEAFPLESSLHKAGLADHLNAEIVNGRIDTLTQAVEMLKGTYLAVRVLRNPNYYRVSTASATARDEFLTALVNDAFLDLEKSYCLTRKDEQVMATVMGKIASKYYLSHRTVKLFAEEIGGSESFSTLLRILSLAAEFDEAPVRHNEDNELCTFCGTKEMAASWQMYSAPGMDWLDPHTKVLVLLVAYLTGVELPVSDFVTDTRSILEQAARIAAAISEVAHANFTLNTLITSLWMTQSLWQGVLPADEIRQLPGISTKLQLKAKLSLLIHRHDDRLLSHTHLNNTELVQIKEALNRFPRVKLAWNLVKQGGHYNLSVTVCDERSPQFAYHRNNQKPQAEWWRLIIGDPTRNAVLAHARITGAGQRELSFCVADGTQSVTLYWLSESYLGLDQEYPVTLK
jgi:replicative superfamily II helicase